MDIVVKRYDDASCFDEWDRFIKEEACNGTFLQSRLFLSYHPEGKFQDCSLLFYVKSHLVAVCPGCIQYEGAEKLFVSHSGSTYGGIIVSETMLRTEKMLALIDAFEQYLCEKGFHRCILKQNNPLMNTRGMDLLDFCLYYKEYREYKELDVYVDYLHYDRENILSNFSKLKKRMTKKCIDAGITLKELTEREELTVFMEILSANLKKYGQKPYHTVDDLMELKCRFSEEIQYWGAVYEGKIVAVSMTFLFRKSGCVHTHYLAADPEYLKLSPMTYIYYQMIEQYKDKGFKTLSWGITTEHLGVEINYNLTNTKEEFGSRHNVVSIFEKQLGLG